jgi:hypothetical protein
MTAFTSSEFDAAVANFKDVFQTNPALYTSGQFYISDWVENGIISNATYLVDSDPALTVALAEKISKTSTTTKLSKLMQLFRNFLTKYYKGESKPEDLYDYLIANFVDTEGNGYLSNDNVKRVVVWVSSLFPKGEPSPAETSQTRTAYQLVWNTTDIAAPWLSLQPNSKLYKAAYKFESDNCFTVCRSLAGKLLAQRSVTRLPAKAKYSAGQLALCSFDPPGPSAPGSGVTCQTVLYGDKAALAAAVSAMRSAVDANAVIQCGVLSGCRWDPSGPRGPMEPEHYVLVFAYGKANDADAFLFWDPDAGATNIASTNWGVGFGCLFVTSSRLSTAIDDTDLNTLNTDGNSDDFGDHIAEPKRHRYQVTYVQTLPL